MQIENKPRWSIKNQSLTAKSKHPTTERLRSPVNTNRVIAPLYIIFKDVQDKRLWSDKLGKLINPLVVRSTQLHNKSEDISRLNINQKRRKKLASLSFAFATSGVSISALCHFPLVSSTRLCVDHSAQRVASQQSLSPPTQSAHTALSPPPLPLHLSLVLWSCLSISHPHISRAIFIASRLFPQLTSSY